MSALETLAISRASYLWETTLGLLERGKEEDDRGGAVANRLKAQENTVRK